MDQQDFFNQLNKKQAENLKKLSKRLKIAFFIILPIIILAVIGFQIMTDFVWMDSLDFENVYTTILKTRVLLGIIGFVVFFIVGLITLSWIRHSYLKYLQPSIIPNSISDKKKARMLVSSISIIIGVIGTFLVSGLGWEPALKVLNYVPFDQADPHFNLNISFYVFILPFLKFIISVLFSLSIFVLVIEIMAYSVFKMYRNSQTAQLHLGVTIGIMGVLLAANHLLKPYETLLTNSVNAFQESVVYGLSYTDDVVNVPAAYILAVVAIAATIWMIVSLIRGKLSGALISVIAYITVVIIAQIASVAVQQFVVSPNEFNKEKPYLEHNLNYTRTAYNLDEIKQMEHPGNQSLTQDMIERNQLTIDNVRINDGTPLRKVYNQKQTFRTYYEFNDIDIDRYMIDGEYSQVFIGARELNTSDLPPQAKTWVNEKLRYTHGYGITMSHVNEIDRQGQPEYILENIPPQGQIDISKPQIYFGEEPYKNVIVNTKEDEFDYPAGSVNESTRFSANTGINLSGLNKLLFAIKEGSFRMLISDRLTNESQLLETRNIMERVKRIAPFFEYDLDPYIVVRDDGGLSWMIDAYLTAENYPYSEPYENSRSYIRNSVKVAVDAYTGEVKFYVSNPDDPLVQTYQNIFPDMFETDIPEDIKEHFRYPQELFEIQAEKYGTYHMSNLEVFYNREDVWQFPTQKYYSNDVVMEPYYISMTLPEEDQVEFILTMPYTPKNRQNMIAWLAVRNDGEHYGELTVYRFPKQKNIYGPQQIENRINQDSYISQELNLWSQGGSNVIRGNLLTIPIEDTMLYVEPIYIESSNETSLPEVKQVVVAYGDYIVMEATFDQALNRILELVENNVPGNVNEQPDDENNQDEPILNAEEVLREVSDLFDEYQEALSQGEWERAGQIMTDIENKLNENES